MIDLNKLCEVSLANATQRMNNGARIDTETRKMLKHTATEVIEATEAYVDYSSSLARIETEDYVSYVNMDDKAFRDKWHFSSELADIICCVLIICGKEQIDVEQAILGCIEKNRLRAEGKGDKK